MFSKFQLLINKILEANTAGEGGSFSPGGKSANFNNTPIHADMSIIGKPTIKGPNKKNKKKIPIRRRNLPKGEL